MARSNIVWLLGKVTKNPKIMVDDAGNYTKGTCLLTTIRGNRNVNSELENIRYDTPPIVSRNPSIIHKMSEWKENDIIQVKGMITTKDVIRPSYCKKCGHENRKVGVLVYITPIAVVQIKSNFSEDKAFEYLKENDEFSNQCILIGNLCDDPQFHRYPNGNSQTQYLLGVNRKFKVKEDPPEIKSDYPMIKSVGTTAENDAKFLLRGSQILVDGAIQTRRFNQTCTCEECGTEYEYEESAMEVFAYSVEYGLNCRTSAEVEAIENGAHDEIYESIFGKQDQS